VTVPIESLFYDDGGPHVLTTGRRPTPRGSTLHALLESGIAGLEQLDSTPFSEPAEIDEELVAIEDLLYSGRAALDRAIEVRNAVRARGGPANQAEVDEIFDLLELATRDLAPTE
jgi:hypothetical protein